MKITIVTPCYNYAQYLDDAIKSVCNQDVLPDEYIIIDDASTDGSREIIKKYKSLKFVKTIYHKKNQGVVSTLNEGLQIARGDFILFLAADDFLHTSILKEYKSYLAKHPDVGFCCGLINRFNQETNKTRLDMPQADFPEGYIAPQDAKKLIRRYGPWFAGNTILFSRKKLLDAGGFSPKLHSYADGFLYIAFALKYGLIFINKPLSTYREHMQAYSLKTGQDLHKTNQIKIEVLKLMEAEPLVFDKNFINLWKRRWDYMQFNFKYIREAAMMPLFGKLLIAAIGFVRYKWFDIFNIRATDIKYFYKKY